MGGHLKTAGPGPDYMYAQYWESTGHNYKDNVVGMNLIENWPCVTHQEVIHQKTQINSASRFS